MYSYSTGAASSSVISDWLFIIRLTCMLLSARVEGLVNSVGGDMDMTAGAIAKSILTKAGQGIQTELTNNKPDEVHYGQVVVTGGHNLNAKWVFHGVLKKWDDGQGDSERVRGFVCFCAETMGHRERRL